MLFFVKVLVSGFRTPFTLHQVPETLFLNGGIKEFVHLKKKKKKTYSRGMGVVDRLIRCLPSYHHPPKLKEIPKVLPQVTDFPVHLPALLASNGPAGLYIDCKRSEADGPDKGSQTSPVPGRLAYQGPVSGRSTSEHSDSGRSDPVLRVDNK